MPKEDGSETSTLFASAHLKSPLAPQAETDTAPSFNEVLNPDGAV